MLSESTIIDVQGVYKSFKIYNRPQDRIMQLASSGLAKLTRQTPRHHYSEFQALKNINFNVKAGETLGVIGHNGSGKSTLLQIICGTLIPTQGSVQTKGRIAALLELGSGFNPDFTGRENIFINGTILGLTHQEIDERFDDIVRFADIGEFVERPVKTYSSGMMVRLAFAVQSQIDPDILIIDEALAVGDAKFQAKCFDRLSQLKEQGSSILLVTHSAEQIVNHCDRALLLNSGEQLMLTEPKIAVNHYLNLLFGRDKQNKQIKRETSQKQQIQKQPASNLSLSEDRFAERLFYNPNEYRWGDGSACITDFDFKKVSTTTNDNTIECGDWLELRTAIRFDLEVSKPILGVTIKNKEGVTLFGTNTLLTSGHQFEQQGKANSACIIITKIHCLLNQGDYFISLGIASKDGEDVVPHDRRYDSIHFQVSPSQGVLGIVNLETTMTIEHSQ